MSTCMRSSYWSSALFNQAFYVYSPLVLHCLFWLPINPKGRATELVFDFNKVHLDYKVPWLWSQHGNKHDNWFLQSATNQPLYPELCWALTIVTVRSGPCYLGAHSLAETRYVNRNKRRTSSSQALLKQLLHKELRAPHPKTQRKGSARRWLFSLTLVACPGHAPMLCQGCPISVSVV